MLTAKKTSDMRKEFPGDEALQQVHLAARKPTLIDRLDKAGL